MVPPRIELGSREPESHMLPLHHGTFSILDFLLFNYTFFMCFFGNIVLLLAYFVIWILFFHKNTLKRGMALAIIPTLLFLLSGLTMRHVLLVCSAIIFGIIQATLIVLRVMGVIDSWFMAYLPLVLLFSFFIFEVI